MCRASICFPNFWDRSVVVIKKIDKVTQITPTKCS